MKLKHLSMFVASLGAMVLFGCTKPVEEETASIEVNPTSLTFKADNPTATSVVVVANKAWKATCEADWITLGNAEQEGDGVLSVSAQPNEGPEGQAAASRTTKIVLTAGTKTVEVPVTQEAESIVFAVDGNASVAAEGGTVVVKVEANTSYNVSISDSWVKAAGTKAIKVDNLAFDVETNTGDAARTATITLTPASGEAKTVTISQASGTTTLKFTVAAGLPGQGVDVFVLQDNPVKITVDAAAGAKSFEATVPMATGYAIVSPAGIAKIEGESLAFSVPSEQDGTLGLIGGTIATRATTALTFTYLTGAISINADESGLSYLDVAGQAREALTGDFTVTAKGVSASDIVITPVADTLSHDVVKLTKASGNLTVAVVPAALTSGVIVMPHTADGITTGAFDDNAVTLAAGKTYDFGKLSAKTTTTYTVSDFAAFQNLLNQPVDTSNVQIDVPANNKAWRLYGTTINLSGTIACTASTKIETNGFPVPVKYTVKGGVLDGGSATGLLVLGNQNDATFDGVTFQNAFCDSHDGGAVQVSSGETGTADVTFTGCTFNDNKVPDGNTAGATPTLTGRSGGAIVVAKGTVTVKNCTFNRGYARNAAGIYTNHDSASLTIENSTFNECESYNTGGAVNCTRGKQVITDCVFNKCHNQLGTGGASHINGATADVTFVNCKFLECEGCTTSSYTSVDNKATGGAISIQEGYLTVDKCLFDGCKGSAASAIYTQKGHSFCKFSNTEFKNCQGASRGLIQLSTYSVCFFNNCTFHDNNMRTNAWGRVIHGANPSVVCMNNCTIYNNTTTQDGGNSGCLNTDGSLVLVNSTVIGSNALTLIRNTSASNASTYLLDNSILINTYDNGKVMDSGKMVCGAASYNCIIGPNCATDEGKWTSSNDLTGATLATLEGGAWDAAKTAFLWNGPASTFTKTTEAAIKEHLNAMTSNNTNTRLNAAFGPAFAEWIESQGGFTKDYLGTTRSTTGVWPGSYEK